MSHIRGDRPISDWQAIADCLFLGVFTLASVVPYVSGLGFYADDWASLRRFGLSTDQSLAGLYSSSMSSWFSMRPAQILYQAGLYKLFGLNPLGYHLFNSMVLVSAIVLLYLVLRELVQRRLIAFSVAALYASLPHYSTDRFLFLHITFSVTMYLLSLYSGLRAVRSGTVRAVLWGLLGIVCLPVSILAYEVALPLFVLNVALIWHHAGSYPYRGNRGQPLISRLVIAGDAAALVLTVIYKSVMTVRADLPSNYTAYLVKTALGAVVINYGTYGVALPYVAWWALSHIGWAAATLGLTTGASMAVYLYYVVLPSGTDWPGRAIWRLLALLGLAVFGFGYAIFLGTSRPAFTSTGVGNRVAIAACIGVAISLVGFLGWASSLLPTEQLRRACFSLLVGLVSTSGLLMIDALGAHWALAYEQQQQVVAEIRRHVPSLPSGSTLILDGSCPYVGPAVVFESSWDLRGALALEYHDATIRADVATPSLKRDDAGITTELYGARWRYPYGKLFVYNTGSKRLYRLGTRGDGDRYFESISPVTDHKCPQAAEGRGVPIFPWE